LISQSQVSVIPKTLPASSSHVLSCQQYSSRTAGNLQEVTEEILLTGTLTI
jgi:hypothetical protein